MVIVLLQNIHLVHETNFCLEQHHLTVFHDFTDLPNLFDTGIRCQGVAPYLAYWSVSHLPEASAVLDLVRVAIQLDCVTNM